MNNLIRFTARGTVYHYYNRRLEEELLILKNRLLECRLPSEKLVSSTLYSKEEERATLDSLNALMNAINNLKELYGDNL